MNALLVIYNVHGDDKRRNALRAAIKSQPFAELSESAYVVLYAGSRQMLWLDLSAHVTTADDLIVSDFDPACFGWHRQEVAEWIRVHVPVPKNLQ